MTTIASTALAAFFIGSNLAGASLPTSWTDSPEQPANPAYQVAMTAYNAVPWQTDSDPLTTASGAVSNPDIIAARSRDLAEELPFGTVISVTAASSSNNCGFELTKNKIGLRVIGDTMNARMRNKIDLLFHVDEEIRVGGKDVNIAKAFGVCKTMIEVVGSIDPKKMPKTQLELRLAIGLQDTVATK